VFKKQQERCIEFLQLSEDYANKHLLDIDAEIRQQSTLLDNLEERLEAAKKLHGDAVDLRIFYESGTVASMNDLRETGISRPLPQDNALFEEVDFVMAEIRRFYEELNKFWRDEICYVVEALKKRRVDPRDFERWNSFRSSLKQTIEFWKSRPPSDDTQPLPCNNTSPSTGVDLGAIASSLSSTSGSFGEALERISSSASFLASLRYSSLSQPSFRQAYVAFAANSDLCLSFLQHCADYGEKVFTWCLSFNASAISSRVGPPHDLRERTARLLSEATGISTENVASVKGSRWCKTTYKKASALEQKTTSELNTLLESLLSWVAVIDGPSGDAPIDVVHPQELGEIKCSWEKARDSLRSALEALTSEPVHHHRSLAFMHYRSALRRWMTSLVRFS